MIKQTNIPALSRLSIREGVETEYKSAKGGVPHSMWETYSAFANTNGGLIVLGVKEIKGKPVVDGLTEEQVLAYKKNVWDIVNNRAKVSCCILEEQHVQEQQLEADAWVLLVEVPRAAYHLRPIYLNGTPNGNTYRRKHEGDYRCTDEEVRQMFSDAQSLISSVDGRLLHGFTMNDINIPTLEKYRREYDFRHEGHPWSALSHEDFLSHIGAYRKDRNSGEEGFTMAGILMFGKTGSITDPECLPYFFPDYREHLGLDPRERWSDRIYPDGRWEANLYEFYLRALNRLYDALPTPFRLAADGVTRLEYTSAHIAIREALANACIHASYTEKSNIVIDRWKHQIRISNPGQMLVSISQFYEGQQSVCRNPLLQKMFVFIGIGEKAGSGADTIVKGWEDNHWNKPQIAEYTEPDRVEMIMALQEKGITLHDSSKTQHDTQHDQEDRLHDKYLTHQVESLIRILGESTLSSKEIMGVLDLTDRVNFLESYLHPAQDGGYVAMTIPDKPKSKNQQYHLTEKGLKVLEALLPDDK